MIMQRLLKSQSYLLIVVTLLPCLGRAESRPAAFVPPSAPKAVFNDEPGSGKDPFFPRSNRQRILVKPTDPEPSKAPVPEFIVLKGVSVIRDQKFAIINNYTLAEGEEFTVKRGKETIKVRCIEIKERSAVIDVGGSTKEIPLRSGI